MDTIIERFKALSIAAVSDAMDKFGIECACLGISPVTYGYKMVGRAFTVKYLPAGVEKGTVGDYIDDVPAGNVVVLDNGGRMDCTVWGDILTAVAHRKGIAGTVVHGVCRDIDRSMEVGYPIFSRGKYMRTGKERANCVAVQVPVSLGDIIVQPGDILFGADDGVLVIPRAIEEEVLAAAEKIEEAEEKIRLAVMDGMSLKEAREKYKYHQLQSKE